MVASVVVAMLLSLVVGGGDRLVVGDPRIVFALGDRKRHIQHVDWKPETNTPIF